MTPSIATHGLQWIWFYVKPAIARQCRLLPPSDWQQKTRKKSWAVFLLGEGDRLENHAHYRHPQVLVYTFGNGQTMELIGVRLKSKIMVDNKKIQWDADGNINGPYLDEALENRIKLATEVATEASDIRDYIRERFTEPVPPALMIMGDCNDGPGQDHFESRHLFFDLVSHLEENIVESGQYFNHALFAYPDDLRWSVKYDDPVQNLMVEDNPRLIDHILMSQTLCNGTSPVVVNAHAGKIEHDAYNWAKGK